ncbi:MAG: nucleotidyltransferase family protein [Candidatus Accumulibacter sp.]|uniref:nucleotidyltransferase family protein n=1 Tax=Accumulibacter sp. TaxID=2053492 RepID=UPI00287A99CB|nr:nucleotidyltransferase family protein [Accumulibacter sp.]MDS4013427.1 nucleotidyltransferase family protein [Accumulibacter sp.]
MQTHGIDRSMDTAIVLAGGLGTRLRAAVPDLPKPMAPVAGRPFLEHLLDYWIAQGIRHFILSVGYKAEVIEARFGTRYRQASIDYAVEETPRGTGGGLLLAAARLTDRARPFLVVNGDTFFAVSLDQLAEAHRAHDADWTFALFRTTENGRYLGMPLAEDGRIRSLDTGASEGERLANGGVYLVSPGALARATAGLDTGRALSLENDLLPTLMAQGGRLFGLPCTGSFIDIGIPDDYRRAGGLFTNSD